MDSVPNAVAGGGRISIGQPLLLSLPCKLQRCIGLAFIHETLMTVRGLLTQARVHAHALQATPLTPCSTRFHALGRFSTAWAYYAVAEGRR